FRNFSVVLCVVIVLTGWSFQVTLATEIYTLSLHDALPIFGGRLDLLDRHGLAQLEAHQATDRQQAFGLFADGPREGFVLFGQVADRKSTRLNSSHVAISYAVFCLKKKSCPGNTNTKFGLYS